MAATQKQNKIDMKHGFMKSIIRNQVDRDNYDKEVKEVKTSKQSQRGRNFNPFNDHVKKPDAAVYIPPSRKDNFTRVENAGNNPDLQVSADDEEDDMPKTLFRFEFEDKDGKIYKINVKEGFTAELLSQRMGYDRKLPPRMIKALQQRLQEEIDKRTKS